MSTMSAGAYDDMATAYAESSATNAYNACYERPASLALLGDVTGQRVLDAGCGPGLHAVELVARGATVTGLDSSAGLLAEARRVLGSRADLRAADLAEPLPLPDDTFDAVLGSLVMHYIEDWVPTLREFHRVLVPGGRDVTMRVLAPAAARHDGRADRGRLPARRAQRAAAGAGREGTVPGRLAGADHRAPVMVSAQFLVFPHPDQEPPAG